MAHTYEELHIMTVAQLREVAKETGEVRGYSSMNKEHQKGFLSPRVRLRGRLMSMPIGAQNV